MVKRLLGTLKIMPTKTVLTKRKGWPRSRRGWKDFQSKKQIAKKTKWALLALGLVLGLLIASKTVKFTQTLFSPWQGSAGGKNFSWNSQFNINILIKAKQISLLSFSPQNQTITIIDIPDNTYLKVPRGFGFYQASSIYDLGQSQKNLGGARLLKETLISQFGLPIDGFLLFSGQYSQNQAVDIASEIRKNPFSIIRMLPAIKTDLTPFELIRLKIGLSAVRFDKIKQINLEEADVLLKNKLLDGTEVLILDTVRFDSILTDMIDPSIVAEHKTIAIFNSTDHPLLAQKAARLITNIGGEVIITSNSQNKFQTTRVTGEKSKTLDRIKQIFGSGGTIDAQYKDLVLSRAQIDIFLGEDYFEQL